LERALLVIDFAEIGKSKGIKQSKGRVDWHG